MKNKKIIGFLVVLTLISAASALVVSAQTFDYDPVENIPGFETETTGDFYTYIMAVYKFGIWAVGIAALFMLILGGYMYITSAGNNASMEKAKTVISDAIIGVVLALTAYLILFIINPDLVKIRTLSQVGAPGEEAPPPTPPAECTQPTDACNCKVSKCVACSSCVAVSGISCKESPCYLNENLLNKLKKISATPNWRITEPWPPTVNHQSLCHQNGTCADVNLSPASTNVNSVKALSDAIKAAGITSFTYESTNCAPYLAVGVPCKNYANTAPTFHINN